jgi:hypothetical protein
MGATRRRATAERIQELAAAASAGEREAATLALHGVVERPDGPGIAEDVVESLSGVAIGAVAADHRARPDEPGLALATLRATLADQARVVGSFAVALRLAVASQVVERLLGSGRLVRDGDHVRVPSHTPGGPATHVLAARERFVASLNTPSPPSLRSAAAAAGCSPDDIRALEREGRLVRLEDDLAWSATAYEGLVRQALELADRSPLTPAGLRDATGTSRKYVLAIIEDLDRRGVLRRTPAGHVPGPRAAALTR